MDTISNDAIPLAYDIPYAVDITLYKYNYYDNLIITQLKKHCQYEIVSKDTSFIVTSQEFRTVLEKHFKRELSSAKSLTEVNLKYEVNSIYFIDRIFNNFTNLEYVKVNISKTREFSRVLLTPNSREIISFDYRIITSVIDLTKYFKTDEALKTANCFLKEINIIKPDSFNQGKPYYTIFAQDLITMIATIEDKFMEDVTFGEQYTDTLDILYSLIDQKTETDNSRIIIITDYPD